MKTVIFACVHNAGRSQMAAAWFAKLADATKARAVSAGTSPGPHVHPVVVDAMLHATAHLKPRINRPTAAERPPATRWA